MARFFAGSSGKNVLAYARTGVQLLLSGGMPCGESFKHRFKNVMKKTLSVMIALSAVFAAVAQAETRVYAETNPGGDPNVYTEVSYSTGIKLTEATTFDVQRTDQAVKLTGNISSEGFVELVKDGKGTLVARVNDAPENTFTGNVTVNQGTLELTSAQIDKEYSIGAGAAGSEAVVTVKKGAELILDEYMGINIPNGNENIAGVTTSVTLRSGKTGNVMSYGDGVSSLSNVVVQKDSIAAQDASDGTRGSVTAYSATLLDSTTPKGAVSVTSVDMAANHIAFSGQATIDNSTIIGCDYLVLSKFSGQQGSFMVQNGSKVIFDNDAHVNVNDAPHVASLSNTEVDKTSYINGGDATGKLRQDMLKVTAENRDMYIQLYAGNTLHIANNETDGGVAVRSERHTPVTVEGRQMDDLEVVYVTEQLSGCSLGKFSDLKVTLDDLTLPDPEKYNSLTFTVVLKGLDSTTVLRDAVAGFAPGTFYDEKTVKSPVTLSIGAYEDAPWYNLNTEITIAAFDTYVDPVTQKLQGPATVFRFKVTDLVAPEPATATLSLLALAALAARRRRH